MNLADLEKLIDQAQTKPLRAVLTIIILIVVGISTIYATHYVGAKAQARAGHRSIEPTLIASPGSNDMERVANGPTIRLRVQSVDRGLGEELLIPRAASIHYLSEVARVALGLRAEADIGGFKPLRVRWVVIQKEAISAWRSLGRERQAELYGIFNIRGTLVSSVSPYDSLEELGLQDGVMLHLAAVEDKDSPMEADVDTIPGGREE